jgi:sugar lactone lactonase YvrE
VAVAGPNNHRVQLFKSDTAKKKTDLDYEKQWGGLSMITSSVTPDDGKFYHPTGIAMDGAGTTYVADTGNHRIQTFDIEGDHLLTIGDRPSYFSNMTTANKGLTHTPSGDTQAGGSATGQFSLPTDVAVAPNGDIWVLDEHNYRIQKFNAKGEFLLQVPKGGVRLLHTLPCAFLGTYSGGMKRLISAARGHPGASTCGPV